MCVCVCVCAVLPNRCTYPLEGRRGRPALAAVAVQPTRLPQQFANESETLPLVDKMQRQLDQYGHDRGHGDVVVVESEGLQYTVVSGLETGLTAQGRYGGSVVGPPERIFHLIWNFVCKTPFNK